MQFWLGSGAFPEQTVAYLFISDEFGSGGSFGLELSNVCVSLG